MPGWAGSTRRGRLPADWPKRHAQVMRRDGRQCQIRLRGCLGEATQVDHIERGDDHELSNLRAACAGCHGTKSGREGARAAHAARAGRKSLLKAPHPGRLAARSVRGGGGPPPPHADARYVIATATAPGF